MKKLLAIAVIIAACAALCAPVWFRSVEDGKVLAGDIKIRTSLVFAEACPMPDQSAAAMTPQKRRPLQPQEKKNIL